jgi:hypothetical protein
MYRFGLSDGTAVHLISSYLISSHLNGDVLVVAATGHLAWLPEDWFNDYGSDTNCRTFVDFTSRNVLFEGEIKDLTKAADVLPAAVFLPARQIRLRGSSGDGCGDTV